MTRNEELVARLEASRALMLAQLDQVGRSREIYPLWTIREIVAHLSGWDDAGIVFIRSILAGSLPETPAARGIDTYNAETVAARQGLDYHHIYREYIETRNTLIDLVRSLPEEKLTQVSTLPWGGHGAVVDIVDIFVEHEEEHAGDVHKIIQQAVKDIGMRFYFVRHGESEANLLREFSNGTGKHPLTELGRQQAQALAQSLAGVPFRRIYASPVLRALQTGEILSKILNVPLEVAPALCEFDVGTFEGRRDREAWQEFFSLWNDWIAGRRRQQAVGGGENFYDIQRRFVPFVERLVAESNGQEGNLLLVGHNGAYRCMLPLVLENIDDAFVQNRGLANTEAVIAEVTPEGRLHCIRWGNE